MCVNGQGAGFVGGRLLRIAFVTVTAAGALSLMPQAEAAIFYWQDPSATSAIPAPKPPVRKGKARHPGDTKKDVVEKEGTKPQGPLIISVSIAQQKVRVYDAKGLFAESPISTGMPGHPTPMGVFSIIQKHKFHHSNIYSGAPMPYMQRITWSGVAMHAGVVPGHPASHGCIRLPMAFAMKMWNWTKMGARVVVTSGDVVPAGFAHPLLASLKVQPQPVAVEETKSDQAAVQKAEKPADAPSSTAPVITEAKLELRSTVGHADDVKPAAEANEMPKVQTANASDEMSAAAASSPSANVIASEPAPQPAEAVASDKDASKVVAEAAAPKSEADSKPADVASSDEKANEKPVESQTEKAGNAEIKSPEKVNEQAGKPELASNDATKPASETTASAAPVEGPKMEAEVQKLAEPAKVETSAPAAAAAATPGIPLKGELKGDVAKAGKPDPTTALKRSNGQIAVFVSRKDSKLYVRQNFSPMFDMAVMIAPSERPLGTHIFTAQVDSSDTNILHWSVVTLPVSTKADRHDERPARGRKMASAGPIEARPMPTPDSPSEALDRLNLPTEAMAKIYEALSTGGSLIVSDQGIAGGETGEGTDFIVSLR